MAIRTEECEVREVIDVDPDASVTIHIKNANIVVDKISSNATTLGITITANELKLIETYLAAHFYALFDQQPSEEQVGPRSRTKYQGKTAMAYDSTLWGQLAKELDPTNTLGSQVNVSVNWLGTVRT